jgi:hypothetical protein
MPLLDHFRPPLSARRPWTGFHGNWATRIAARLNRMLPEGWIASPITQWNVEVDVGAFEEPLAAAAAGAHSQLLPLPEPRRPQMTVAFPLLIDKVGVRVYRELGELELVGIIELVSEGNKDRPDARDALLSKCEASLHEGIGVMLVDAVTTRRANLHAELLDRIGIESEDSNPLYASSYRPKRHGDSAELDIWYEPLELGRPIPSMPLALRGGPSFEVDLETPYLEACAELRIDPNKTI